MRVIGSFLAAVFPQLICDDVRVSMKAALKRTQQDNRWCLPIVSSISLSFGLRRWRVFIWLLCEPYCQVQTSEMTRSRAVEATEGQTEGHELKSRKRRRQAARQSQEEETEIFVNAPRLKTNPDGACELRRPAKRRRIRSQLVLPDGWEVYKKQIFRVRPPPEVCRSCNDA
ncbi:hypothetical protein AK812_SmicGene26776 [Symbiodinium microadriaticum]|uniref:Uncharacterized protein n=1 Tax=Symbiodinium microadriaticum TaxID=2951 RepID=A0A1Q9D8N7_SYMMI|nr:hypothetical protein AK812_SmicGene26776 [Symbiodinium microadriaticum]